MLRTHRTARSRRPFIWIGLLLCAAALLLAVGGCGIGGDDSDTPEDAAPQEDITPEPTVPVTLADLPDLVLQRLDVPDVLELVPTENASTTEYTVEYELPDPEASLTGFRSVSSAVSIGTRAFPSLSDVRSYQRHTEDAVEIPNTHDLGDKSVLYRVTVLADHANNQIYFGYITYEGLTATVISVKGTLPTATPEEVEATLDDVLLIMKLQEGRLLGTDPSSVVFIEPTPVPTTALTILDLPGVVLQPSDVPAALELAPTENQSEVEYTVAYELPESDATLTGLRSVSSTVRIGDRAFPSLDDVRSLQRHTEDAVEIPDISGFGDESILYRVTALADQATHQIYYGYIKHAGLIATVIGVQGTPIGASPEEVQATVADALLLMQSQEARLFASGS